MEQKTLYCHHMVHQSLILHEILTRYMVLIEKVESSDCRYRQLLVKGGLNG